MKINYKAKSILVTGGSRGIGLAIVNKFYSKGYKVYFTYLKSKKNYLKKKGLLFKENIIPIKCDMTKLSNIKKLKKKLKKEKKIDILVNNVGDVFKRCSFHQSTDELWEKTFDLNLKSSVRTTRVLIDKLKVSGESVVINISSIASRAGGSGDSLHYGVAKSAVNTFTSGLAREFRKQSFGIRVIGVAPSIVDTDFQKRNSTKKRLNKIIKETPMKRIAKVEEISDLIEFIASDKSGYLSGDTIFITGGR